MSFSVNNDKPDGYATFCKVCMREYGREHYRRNKRYYVDKAQRHRKKIRPAITLEIARFRSVRCTECLKKHPLHRMQCDHVRGRKKFNIAQALQLGVSLKALRKELSKCEAVCANCHADRTHERLQRKKK